jgi:hypothetical protein
MWILRIFFWLSWSIYGSNKLKLEEIEDLLLQQKAGVALEGTHQYICVSSTCEIISMRLVSNLIHELTVHIKRT